MDNCLDHKLSSYHSIHTHGFTLQGGIKCDQWYQRSLLVWNNPIYFCRLKGYSFNIPPALQFRLKAYMDVAPDINRKTCGAHMDNLGPADVVSGLGLTKPHCHSCQPKHSKVKSTQARTHTSAQQFSASAVTLPSTPRAQQSVSFSKW